MCLGSSCRFQLRSLYLTLLYDIYAAKNAGSRYRIFLSKKLFYLKISNVMLYMCPSLKNCCLFYRASENSPTKGWYSKIVNDIKSHQSTGLDSKLMKIIIPSVFSKCLKNSFVFELY